VDVFSNSCPHTLAKTGRFSEEFKNKFAHLAKYKNVARANEAYTNALKAITKSLQK